MQKWEPYCDGIDERLKALIAARFSELPRGPFKYRHDSSSWPWRVLQHFRKSLHWGFVFYKVQLIPTSTVPITFNNSLCSWKQLWTSARCQYQFKEFMIPLLFESHRDVPLPSYWFLNPNCVTIPVTALLVTFVEFMRIEICDNIDIYCQCRRGRIYYSCRFDINPTCCHWSPPVIILRTCVSERRMGKVGFSKHNYNVPCSTFYECKQKKSNPDQWI